MKELMQDLKSFFYKSKRVWYVLKKPTRKEFVTITKVSAFGILIIGVAGFFISIIMGFFI